MAVVYGNASSGTRLRSRTSTGSSPTAPAKRSIARSTSQAASGRPAPRKATVGVVFVTTEVPAMRARGKAYTPVPELRRFPVTFVPIAGWQPLSCRACTS